MKIKLGYVFLLLLSLGCTQAQPDKFDHSNFDLLLKANVDEIGMVNYLAFKNNQDFDDYIASITEADLSNLNDFEKLAFYINAYNATVIKNVVDHWPLDSPMDVEGFFNKIKHRIAGKEITLDELEHEYALKIEPVLSHFGLVCAAQSCPKLTNIAYNSKTIINQLEENGKVFLNDDKKNKLDRENKILYLSELFRWFKNSFIEKYGSLENTALNFMNAEDKLFIKNNEIEIKFLKYNWKLNTQ
jgi:hypothetical protein